MVGIEKREHARPHARPRAGSVRADRCAARWHGRGHEGGAACGHGRLSDRGVPSGDHTGDALRRLHDPADILPRPRGRDERHTRRSIPRRRPPRGDRPGRTGHGSCFRRARHGPGRGPAKEPDPVQRFPLYDRLRHHIRRRRLRASAERGSADRRIRTASSRAGAPARPGRPHSSWHRRLHVRRDHFVREQGVRVGGGAPRRRSDCA